MRILIFNWRDIRHDWAGGGEVYVHELAKRWVRFGNTVTLFCGQNVGKKLPEREKIDGILILRHGGRFSVYFWAIFYYFKELRNHTDIVVDVQNGIPFFTPLFSFKPKLAVVYHVHGKQFFIELPFPINLIGYLVEKYVFPFLYGRIAIQAISKNTKSDLIHLGLPAKNITIIYCGMNGHAKKLITIHKFSNPTVLYLGRIKKYKRVDSLVAVMQNVIRVKPKTKLIIAGWGTEASSVVNSAMMSSIRKHIHILGPVSESEKKQLLAKSWVFVNPSINEGWGISVIEANLYGTPAIAYRVQGLRESIRHGKTGLLVKDEKSFSDAIITLLSNTTLRNSMGKRAKLWAAKFNWDKASKKSLRLLDSLYRRHK
ncbi:MAG: glycosyltransferase family 4 protein [Candidatus Gottesmanbacteria bacterium]